MNYVGTAQLIQYKHSTGAQAQGWAMNPWIPSYILHMGLLGAQLPPPGSTVDRGLFRIDTSNGAVFKLVPGDPPPAIGPTGGPGAIKAGFGLSPIVILVIAAAAFFGRKRGKRAG